jgi:hypothetical protein
MYIPAQLFFFDYRTLNMKATRSFETSETTDSTTRRHIPEHLNARCVQMLQLSSVTHSHKLFSIPVVEDTWIQNVTAASTPAPL